MTVIVLLLLLGYVCSTTYAAQGGLLVPLYVYPTEQGKSIWKAVKDAASANPSVPFVVVVNPNSGPGSSFDPEYSSVITDLVSSGVKCIGYVPTNYSNVPSSTVTENMDKYKSWYPQISGFFLDEMAHSGNHEKYYADLTDHAASVGCPYTVGNPGTGTSRAYFDTVNNTVIYETQHLPHPSVLDLGFPRSGCSMIAYNVPGSQLNQSYFDEVNQYVSLTFVSDDVLDNPYDTLPTYFEQLVQFTKGTGQQKNSKRTSTRKVASNRG